jgi:hypothetical protein
MNPPPCHNVIVCGSTRSGTTWLMEILSAGIDTQFDFEPLEPSVHPAVRTLKLRNRYLCPDRTYETLDPVLETIVQGRFVHPYTKGMGLHPFHYRRWKFWARNHVIKMVQGHMLLGYLQQRFGCRRIVLLLRHPFGVIASLKRQDWWRSDLEEFLDERSADLFRDYPELQKSVSRATTLLHAGSRSGLSRKIGDTAIRYCLENYVPIRQHLNRRCSYEILRYEDLAEDPVGRASALCRSLGIRFTRARRKQTGKRSRTSFRAVSPPGSAGGGPEDLPREERELVAEILKIFSFDSFFDGYFLRPERA